MKNKRDVGKLKVVPIRELFRHEAHDFTVWLAENIDLLSERIGLQLIVRDREVSVGKFQADLVCEDSQSGRVVIENQLEKTDHDHFGKLMTYMTNLDADTGIWITTEPRIEHQLAIEKFNNRHNQTMCIYLVKLEAIQIDNSSPSPFFTVITRPPERPAPVVETEAKQYTVEVEKKEPISATSSPTVWCFYPQRNEKTYELFLNKKVVGLGFGDELGDLSKLEPTLEDFKNHFLTISPRTSPNAARTFYTMFYSFVHRIKIGDRVVYAPTWREPKIYVGKITGAYTYNPGILWSFYGHRRSVEWIAEFARNEFSPEALRGITVTLAIFQARSETFLDELTRKMK